MKRADIVKLVGQPVRVVWNDAVGLSEGWTEISELVEAQLPECETLSYLVHVSKNALHLASTRHENGVAGTGLIPLRWVLRITPLGDAHGAPLHP